MTNTFHNSHFVRYYHSLFVVRDCTKYIQNHLSMAIILFSDIEEKLLKKMEGTP